MKQKLFFYLLFLSSIMTAQIQNFNMKVKFNDVDKSTSLTNSQILVRHPTTNLLMWVEPSLVTGGFIPITHVVNGITQSNINNWNSAYTYSNTQRVLTLNETLGSIRIDNGTAMSLNGLALKQKEDASTRYLENGFIPFRNQVGSEGYPNTSGSGIRIERYVNPTTQTGFEIWNNASANNHNLYFRRFWGTDNEGEWKIFADRDWVTSQMSNYVPFTGAGNDVNLGSRNISSKGYYLNDEISPTNNSKAYQAYLDVNNNRYLTFKLTEKIYSVNTRMQINISVRENTNNLKPGNISIGLRFGSDISAIVSDNLFNEIVYYEDEETGYITVKLRNTWSFAYIEVVNTFRFSEIIRQNELDLTDKTNVVYAPIKVQAYDDEVLKLTGGTLTGTLRIPLSNNTHGITLNTPFSTQQARDVIRVNTNDNTSTIARIGFLTTTNPNEISRYFIGSAVNIDEWFRVYNNGNIQYAGTVSKMGGSANNILLENGSVLDKNTLATTSQVGNGNISYLGTGSITGGGVSTANQTGNTAYTFDLTSATKADIAKGVTAHGWGDFRDFGLGMSLSNVSDADTIDVTSFYSTGSSFNGSPFVGIHGANQGYLNSYRWRNNPNYMFQEHISLNSQLARRHRWKINGSWTAWRTVWDSETLTSLSQLTNDVGFVTSDTTYETNTLAQLNTGTDTTGKLQTAKNLNDWIVAKGYLTQIPIATSSVLGGIKVGTNLSVTSDGTLSATNTTYSNMTLSELNTGTSTTARTISSKNLNDWLNGKNFVSQSSMGNYMVLDNINITNQNFKIRSGTQDLLFEEDYGLKIENNTLSNNWTTIGSDDGYALEYYNGNNQRAALTIGGVSGSTNNASWNITKNYSDNRPSNLELPETGSTPRRFALSVNGNYANSSGDISINTGEPANNPEISFKGIGYVDGGGEITLNQTNNQEISFDLRQFVKDNIGKGVEAYDWGDHSQEGYVKQKIYTITQGIVVPSGPFELDILDACPLDYDPSFINWDITYNWSTGPNRQLRTIKTEYFSKGSTPLRITAPTIGGCPKITGDNAVSFTIPQGAKLILTY